jgi:hypothetical protein
LVQTSDVGDGTMDDCKDETEQEDKSTVVSCGMLLLFYGMGNQMIPGVEET